MLLFLVRHACSDISANRWQTPDSKIGNVGKKQAEILSERSRFSQLAKIFSSDWNRSKETAEIISKRLKVKTESLNYIHERVQSPEIYGSLRESRISKKYINGYRDNNENLSWKFEPREESIKEVLKRASRLSNFLIKNYKEECTLVVSHDMFIRCFIGIAMLGRDYSDTAMARVINSLVTNYTGISLLRYNYQMKQWKIHYINDFSHLRHMARKKV